MFTGLVEGTGRIESREPRGPNVRIRFGANLGVLELGESVAVSGACLTVTESDATSFSADVSRETLDRTTLGAVPDGGRVNLERSLRVGDRLGGHLVTGHVDGVGTVVAREGVGDAARVRVRIPTELVAFVAEKGSITFDGVSLTVNEVDGAVVGVMLVPHTLSVTTLGDLEVDIQLNVEVDLIARYVARHLTAGGDESDDSRLMSALRAAGRT